MAAEMQQNADWCRLSYLASMRPRRMAAEIALVVQAHRLVPVGFNEAAANGRGNPTYPGPLRRPTRLQ